MFLSEEPSEKFEAPNYVGTSKQEQRQARAGVVVALDTNRRLFPIGLRLDDFTTFTSTSSSLLPLIPTHNIPLRNSNIPAPRATSPHIPATARSLNHPKHDPAANMAEGTPTFKLVLVGDGGTGKVGPNPAPATR